MPQSESALSRLPLRTTKQARVVLRNPTQADEARAIIQEIAQELAAHTFDDAVEGARLTNQVIAFELGISESLVGRWRNPAARESPSIVQLQQIGQMPDVGPVFLCEVNKACTRRNGLGRRVLRSLLDSVGDLAVAVGE